MSSHSNKGVSVIEILAVLAVFGILILIALPQFSRLKENQVLRTSVSDALSAIDKARSKTLASAGSSAYGVHFESGKVIIFKGAAFSPSDPNNEEIGIASPASITNVTLNGSSGTSGSFYFNRLSGTPSKNGTVTISTGTYSKTITISATGTASSN